MASPAYATDLITSLQGNDATEAWDESSDAAYDDGGAMVDDGNLYYINTQCVSAQFTKDGIGSIIGALGSTITVPLDGAILMHHLWAAPPALATFALGGVRMLIGDGLGAFKVFYVSGSDKSPAPEGGWATYAVDPAQTPQGTTIGSPTAISFVGGAISATAQARGNPHAVQAIRYGRCEQEYTLGEVANPAKFSGFAAIDSTATTRYNLLQPIKGGYLQRGLISFGTASVAVHFDDANVNISLANDINVSANFNRIEVNNTGSVVNLTTVSISALGTVSKGQFEMIANAALAFKTCTFTGMGTFIFLSNATLTGNVFRSCGVVALGGATLTGGLFDSTTGTSAVQLDGTRTVSGTTFLSADNNEHAIYIDEVGTYTITGCTFTDYDTVNGGANTVIYNNSGGAVTVNVSGNAGTISYTNGTGASTTVQSSSNINIHVQDEAKVLIASAFVYINDDDSGAAELNTLTNASGDVSTSYSGSVTTAALRIRKYGYKPFTDTVDISSDLTRTITLIADPQQT